MTDYRDVVIGELADSEARLRERVRSLEQDVEAYRALAQQAIHQLHRLTQQHDRLRLVHHHALDELRALWAEDRRAA